MQSRPMFLALALSVAVQGAAFAQDLEVLNRPFRAAEGLPVAPYRAPVAASGLNPLPVAAPVPTKRWELRVKDITVNGAFQRWAQDAGWQVRWDAAKHVFVEAPDILQGSFEEVVRTVLESPGISKGAYPLEVCFYPNTPPLARVTRRGDQAKECL